MRTLIVETDFTSRMMLQSFLSRYGVCHIAANGSEAVTAFRAARESRNKYDLICVDVMMAETGGLAAIKQIREIEEPQGSASPVGVKIITTSAPEGTDPIQQSVKFRTDACVFKPIDTGRLLQHIREFHLI
jgi:two-component system chemotaxis response regulator CheY